jgi:hypothetical protein
MRKKWVMILLVFGVVLAGCASEPEIIVVTATPEPLPSATPTPGPCDVEQLEVFADAAEDFMEEFADGVDVAGNTARISLSGPIMNLQSLTNNFQAYPFPVCASAARMVMIKGADKVIEGFIGFMGQNLTDRTANSMIDEGIEAMILASSAIEELRLCAPNCD